MAHIIADRIKETAIVIGTGTASLLGAVSGHKAFSSAMSIGDTCIYVIINSSGSQWETGIGTYSAVNTITRTTVKSSTNNNNLVVFNGEVVNIFMGVTAASFSAYDPTTKTITDTTWSGNTIATSKGGTGLNTVGTANQILIVNAGGTALEYKTPQLNTLSDVAVGAPADGDLLRYSGLTQDWINSSDVMAVNGDSWNTLLRRMNKLMESLTIVDSQQRQRVAVETMPTTTVAGSLTVQSSAGNFTGQNQAVGGAVTSTVSTYFVSEAPVDQRWRIIDDSHTCYAVSIRSKLTFS
jgi:hypothetical protein